MDWSRYPYPPLQRGTYDRVQKDDVMQSSMIEARFAYNAATRPEMLPRIPTPAPDPNVKGHE